MAAPVSPVAPQTAEVDPGKAMRKAGTLYARVLKGVALVGIWTGTLWLCPHGKTRAVCKPCGGASICTHGRKRSECWSCGGCDHGKVRIRCKECWFLANGAPASPTPPPVAKADPGKARRKAGTLYTRVYKGVALVGIWTGTEWHCTHGKMRCKCKACWFLAETAPASPTTPPTPEADPGKALRKAGTLYARVLKGVALVGIWTGTMWHCPHGKTRAVCKPCGGASICTHGRKRCECRSCGGTSFCDHGRVRLRCKECWVINRANPNKRVWASGSRGPAAHSSKRRKPTSAHCSAHGVAMASGVMAAMASGAIVVQGHLV